MKRYITVINILFCMMTNVFAAHPLTTDDIGIVGVGKYELELGYDNCKVENELRSHPCGLSLKRGISEKIDIGVSFLYQVKSDSAESPEIDTIGFKLLLIKNVFALSVNNEFGSNEYFINGIFSHEFQPIIVHANIGYATSDNEDAAGTIVYSAAFEYPLSNINIDFVGEVTGDKIGFQNWLSGVRYKITDPVFLDVGYGNGFGNDEEKISFGVHIDF